MSTYIYIIDDLVFFFVGIVILYLFVLAVAAHFKRIVYPKLKRNTIVLSSFRKKVRFP